jgi:hypothetical protein
MNVWARILYTVVLLLSLIFLSWWLFLLIGILGTFLFPKYYEFVIFSFFFDLVYGLYPAPTSFFYGNTSQLFLISLCSVFFVIFVEFVKKYLKFYHA